MAAKIIKYFVRFVGGLLLILLLVFIAAFILIQRPAVQTFLVQFAAEKLSEKTGAEVSVQEVEIRFFNKLRLNDVYVSDLQGDTLAYIRHFDTRLTFINPFKNRYYFNSIELDGLRANIHRPENDSTFNFQFLIDAFSNPDALAKKKAPETGEKAEIDIRLGDILFSDLRVVYDDPFGGQGHLIELKKLKIKIEDINITQKALKGKYITLEDPVYQMSIYHPKPEDTLPDKPFSFNMGWNIVLGELKLTNGRFALHDLGKGKPLVRKGFDPSWIDINDIQLHVRNYSWDSVMALDLKKLSAFDEADALMVKNLSGQIGLSDQYIFAQNLSLAYNEATVLDADARIDFDGLEDFADFLNKVRITANVRTLRTNGEDVAVWAKSVKKYVPDVSVSGSITGTISDLSTRNLAIRAGKRTLLEGDVNVKGLPSAANIVLDTKIKQLKTNTAELARIAPYLKLPAQIKDLGNVAATGQFKGSLQNFATALNVVTDKGNLKADVRMKFPKKKPPIYEGTLYSDGINLSPFIGTDIVGNAAFNLKVNGSGFNLDEINTTVEGSISNFDLNYYRYERLDLNGYFSKKMFEGSLHMEDECAIFDFAGLVDLNNAEQPRYNFYAKIVDADLQQLNILPNKLIANIEGKFEFEGKDLNHLYGQADLSNIRLQDNNYDVNLSDFQICLETDGQEKLYTVKSEDVDIEMRGDFDPLKLPVSMQFFFSKHTNLLASPGFESFDALTANQEVKMNITIKKDFGLVSLIDPKISKFSDVKIAGYYNNQSNQVNLDIKVDSLIYDNVGFNQFKANLFDRNDSIIVTSSLNTLDLGKFKIRDIRLGATSNLTGLYSRLRVEPDSAKNNLELITAARFLGDTIDISFPRSKIKINNNIWNIAQGNRIVIVDSAFQLNNFILQQGEQSIAISNRGNLSDATVDISKLNLADLIQLIDTTGLLTRGTLDASINVRNALKSPEVDGDILLSNLTVYGQDIDKISLDAKLSERDKSLMIKGAIVDDEYDVVVNGKYSLDPKEKSPIDLQVDFARLDLAFLGYPIILGNEISELKAAAKGKINVSGTPKTIALDGNATIIDTASVKVNILGAKINLADEDIVLKPKSIEFFKGGLLDKNITIFDDFGNRASLRAKLEHEYFKNFSVNAAIVTDRFNFMNTTYNDNNLFFGRVFASGAVNINGPVADIKMDITARTLPGTEFNVVAGGSDNDKLADFVNFSDRSKRVDSTGIKPAKPKSSSALSLDMNIIATQDAQVRMYLDYAANDVIRARGNGDLQLKLSSDGSMPNMTGEYVVTGGDYLFSQQDIVNKPFAIRNGSRISWSGDMMDARMDVQATYTARPNMNSIVDSSSNLRNRRFPVDVVLKIGGTLSETKIDFQLEPARGQTLIPDELNAVLERVNQDPNQVNSQAFGLILFNSFINLQGTGFSQTQIGTMGMATLTEFFNAKVSEYFNEALEMLLPGTEVAINQGVDNTGIRLTRKLSNERLIINLGGDVQYGRERLQLQQNTGFIGDVELEYLVTEDGRIRFRAYSRYDNTIIRLENESYLRTGVGITYQKEFNRLNQLFMRENRGKKKPKLPATSPAPSPGLLPGSSEQDGPVSDNSSAR